MGLQEWLHRDRIAAANHLNAANQKKADGTLFADANFDADMTNVLDINRKKLDSNQFQQYVEHLCEGIGILSAHPAHQAAGDLLVARAKKKLLNAAHYYSLSQHQIAIPFQTMLSLATTTAQFAVPGGGRDHIVGQLAERAPALAQVELETMGPTPRELTALHVALTDFNEAVQGQASAASNVQKALNQITTAIGNLEAAHEKIGEIHGVTLDEADEECVAEGKWLTDRVMTAYINKLNAEHPESSTYVVDPAIVPLLISGAFKKEDLPPEAHAADRFVCLINSRQKDGSHWMTLDINLKANEVRYYNSKKDKNAKGEVISDTFEGSARNSASRIVSSLTEGAPGKSKPFEFTPMVTPQQGKKNSSDCGPIALTVAEALKRGDSLEDWHLMRGKLDQMVQEAKQNGVHRDLGMPATISEHIPATAANIVVNGKPLSPQKVRPEAPKWSGPCTVSNIVEGGMFLKPNDRFQNSDGDFELTTEAYRQRRAKGAKKKDIEPQATLGLLYVSTEPTHPVSEGDIRKTVAIGDMVDLEMEVEGRSGPAFIRPAGTLRQSSGEIKGESSKATEQGSSSSIPPAQDAKSVKPIAIDEQDRVMFCNPRRSSGEFDESTVVGVVSEQLLGSSRSFKSVAKELSGGNATAFTTSTAEAREKCFPKHQQAIPERTESRRSKRSMGGGG